MHQMLLANSQQMNMMVPLSMRGFSTKKGKKNRKGSETTDSEAPEERVEAAEQEQPVQEEPVHRQFWLCFFFAVY